MFIAPFKIEKTITNEDEAEIAVITDDFGNLAFHCHSDVAKDLVERLNEHSQMDYPEKRNEPISRMEDMSCSGKLSVLMQDDGDMCVLVYSGDDGGRKPSLASVEFCIPGTGGGKSPRTHAALVRLAAAMELDNNDPSLDVRSEKYYYEQQREAKGND